MISSYFGGELGNILIARVNRQRILRCVGGAGIPVLQHGLSAITGHGCGKLESWGNIETWS